jgi:hypothetical protein
VRPATALLVPARRGGPLALDPAGGAGAVGIVAERNGEIRVLHGSDAADDRARRRIGLTRRCGDRQLAISR